MGSREIYPKICLDEICDMFPGTSEFNKTHYVIQGYPCYSAAGQDGCLNTYKFKGEAIILSSIDARCGKCFLPMANGPRYIIHKY